MVASMGPGRCAGVGGSQVDVIGCRSILYLYVLCLIVILKLNTSH